MLKITKVTKADRRYLGSAGFNPLAKIFNVQAVCENNDLLTGECMGDDFERTIENGETYNLLVHQFNSLKSKSPEVGDTYTLKELSKSSSKNGFRVLNSDMPMKWKRPY